MNKRRGTIDLRNSRSKISETHAPAQTTAQKRPPTLAHAILAPATFSLPEERDRHPKEAAQPDMPPLPQSLEWTAFEHEQVDFGHAWYAVPGGIMAILFALALWVQNYFFALFVIIAFATFMLFRNQPPRKIAFSISHDGIRAGKTLYQISRIKSFWIFNRPEHPELSLETSQTFSPYVRLPLGTTDQQHVRELLLTLLPEEQHQQFLMDEIMRIIGF
ncbi:MAG: hypothetical protein HY617_03425 [Candidatus Sungbacteria bacterium]|nr:hypothetical protein [Candidatus Sungbacteria bacterium]